MARGESSRISLSMMETLVAVVECDGDGQAAAERLGIGQPTMSKRLALLQHSNRAVRYPYLEKQGKTWLLTDEGRRNIDAIRNIVRLSRLLQDDVDQRVAGTADLSIACGQLAVRTFVRQALLQLRRQRPELRLRVSTPRGRERIVGVSNGQFDLALVSHDEAEIHRIARRTLHVETLFDDPWVLVCGRKSPKALRDRFDSLPEGNVKLKDLVGLPLVLMEPNAGLRQQLDRAFIAAGVQDRLEIVMEIGGWPALLDAVRDSFGIGLVNRSAAAGESGLLQPRPLTPRETGTPAVRLVRREREGMTQATGNDPADELVTLIREAIRTMWGS